MIPALSPLLTLLAPKAPVPAGGDAAAFGLALAGLGEAMTGRQGPAPGGNPVPPTLDAALPSLPVEVGDVEDVSPPIPPRAMVAAALPAAAPAKATGPVTRPIPWPRHARPDSGAEPAPESDAPMTTGEMETYPADPAPPQPFPATPIPTPIREEGLPTHAAFPDPLGQPEPTRPPGPTPVSVRIAPASLAAPVARPTDDKPHPSPEPIPTAPVEPFRQPVALPVIARPAPPRSSPVARPSTVRPAVAPAPDLAPPQRARTGEPVIGRAAEPAGAPARPAPPLGAAPLVRPEAMTGATLDIGPARDPVTERIVPRSDAEIGLPAQAQFPALPPSASLTWASRPSPIATARADWRPIPTGAAPPPAAASPLSPIGPAGSALAPAAEIASPAPQPVMPGVAQPASPGQAITRSDSVAPPTAPIPAAPPVEPAPQQTETRSVPSGPVAPDRMALPTTTPTLTRTVMSGAARQVFAADLRRIARDPRALSADMSASPVETPRLDAATAVTAPAAAPLDLRQDRWPSAMVERIERLRDAVDAVDTRIRLIPDALGAIDVAVKRDGDTVHVHFTAEQAATRTLLQDAAPRLAEAAEARGLKLGQTGVGDGGSAPNGRQPQPNAAPVPARPRAAAAADEDSPDTRIA